MKKLILDTRKIHDYGIGEYIKTLFPEIINSGKFDVSLITNNEDKTLLTETIEPKIGSIFNVKAKNYSILEHFEIPGIVKDMKNGIYFSPHYIFPFFIKNRMVVTIHDLIHFKFPEYFKPRLKVNVAGIFIKKIMDSDSIVFTVSENSKKDLIDLFGFNKNSIKVIYNGLPEIFFKYKKGVNPKPFKYIMYTGNFKPHKNLVTLLEAFKIINSIFPDLRLILAGVKRDKNLEILMKKFEIGDRIITTGYIPREDLIGLLDFAELFVFPSIYEGFGFPPLEAMSRKKAVISTKCGSLYEILGDSAVYFDPKSAEELAFKIEKLLTDSTLRSGFEKKGYLRAKKYTGSRMTSEYIRVLEQL